jgi:hypothetical protein
LASAEGRKRGTKSEKSEIVPCSSNGIGGKTGYSILLVLPVGGALLAKGGHTLLLVLGGER